MPAYLIATDTSFGPRSRRSIVVFSNGALGAAVAYAVTVRTYARPIRSASPTVKPGRVGTAFVAIKTPGMNDVRSNVS